MKRTFADMSLGLTFESPSYHISEEDALDFARRFDPQPFHTDPDAARNSFFKGLAVSGWYTASRVFSLLLQSNVDMEGGIIGQAVHELSWLGAVRPGDTLRVTSEVVEVTPSAKDPRRGTVILESVAFNQSGERVFVMRARVLAPAPRGGS